ncbi:MAG: hypothetical protein ACRDPA_32100, partial [Solirubrobacteraceae bacterium]
MPLQSDTVIWGSDTAQRIVTDAYNRGKDALHQLRELPNAGQSDQDALVLSVREIVNVAQALEDIDRELQEASNWQLLHSGESDFGDAVQAGLRNWVEQNIPAPQDADLLVLIERRGELGAALTSSHQSLRRTCSEIDDTHRKLKAIAAAGKIERDAGRETLPELSTLRAQEAEERVAAIAAGV